MHKKCEEGFFSIQSPIIEKHVNNWFMNTIAIVATQIIFALFFREIFRENWESTLAFMVNCFFMLNLTFFAYIIHETQMAMLSGTDYDEG